MLSPPPEGRAGGIKGYDKVTGRDLERAIAKAHPGTVHDLPEGMADLALALLDRETRVHAEDPALARRWAVTRITGKRRRGTSRLSSGSVGGTQNPR